MKYADLDEAGQERARQWFKDSEGEMWGQDRAPDYYEDMATCLKFLGITVSRTTRQTGHYLDPKDPRTRTITEYDFTWSGFWSQGDGLVFEGTWDARDVSMSELKEYAPQDAKLEHICAQMTAIMLACPTAHAKIVTVNYGPGLPGMHVDESCVDSEGDIPMPMRHEQLLKEQIIAAAHWCYKQLEDGYEYDTSDEAAVDAIEANEYDFDRDGDRITCSRPRRQRVAATTCPA